MLSTPLLVGFIIASLVVLVLPGPGVLYVVARSVSQGRRAGLASVVGLSLGALVHVIAAAAGLSALLLTSATAFGIVKMLGAGYLIYLGARTLLSKNSPNNLQDTGPLTRHRLVLDGIVVSLFNPKIAIFFMAFLPQFVDPAFGSIAVQILFLGLIYVGLAFLTDGTYALLAASLRQRLGRRFFKGSVPRYIIGSLYIGLGVNAALLGRRI